MALDSNIKIVVDDSSSMERIKEMDLQLRGLHSFDPTLWPEEQLKQFERSMLEKHKEYKEFLKQKIRTVRCL